VSPRQEAAELTPEMIRALLPVGPRQVPFWITCAAVGLIAAAAEWIGIAWALHADYYGFGPRLGRWVGLPRRMYLALGTTWFVLCLNGLTLLLLQRNLWRLRRVRGSGKRSLVRTLFYQDVRSVLWSLLLLCIFGLVLMRVAGVQGQSILEWVKDLYVFFWGFTQYKHPMGIQTAQRYPYLVPLVVRIGAVGLFVSLGLLGLRILGSWLYLLVVRPPPEPPLSPARRPSGTPGDTAGADPA
jgi:hypothetical protein